MYRCGVFGLFLLSAVSGEVLRGSVVRLDGSPAVGAAVQISYEVAPLCFERVADVVSREDGRFVVPDLRPGHYEARWDTLAVDGVKEFDLTPLHDGEVQAVVDWPWAHPPLAELDVTVTDGAGKPVESAEVEIDGGGWCEPVGQWAPMQTVSWGERIQAVYGMRPLGSWTDDAGTFRVPLPTGLVSLRVGVTGAPAVNWAGVLAAGDRRVVHLRQKAVQPARARYIPHRRTSGVRVLAPDGSPLANQTVLLCIGEDDATRPTEVARLDAGGAVREDYYASAISVWVKAKDYQPVSKSFSLTDRYTDVLTLRLGRRSRTATGSIADATGRPLSGGRVFLCGAPTQDGSVPEAERIAQGRGARRYERWSEGMAALPGILNEEMRWAVSGPDGRFTLTDVEDGDHSLVFRTPGYRAQIVRRVDLHQSIDLWAIPETVSLTGRVLGPDGQPWREKPVRLTLDRVLPANAPPRTPPDPERPVTESDFVRYTSISIAASCDAAGIYKLRELTPGYARVTLDVPGYRPVRQIVHLSSQAPARLDGRLQPKCVVQGRVVRPDGSPAAEAWVQVLRGQTGSTCWAGSGGEFELPDVDEGEQRLLVFANGCGVLDQTITVPLAPFTVQLKPGFTVRAAIRESSGDPSSQCQAGLIPTGSYGYVPERPWWRIADVRGGQVWFPCVPAGSYRAWAATYGDHRSVDVDRTIAGDAHLSLTLPAR